MADGEDSSGESGGDGLLILLGIDLVDRAAGGRTMAAVAMELSGRMAAAMARTGILRELHSAATEPASAELVSRKEAWAVSQGRNARRFVGGAGGTSAV